MMSPLLFLATIAQMSATNDRVGQTDVVVRSNFDRVVISRGDVAYCEVRIVNISKVPRELTAPIAEGNVWFEVELVGDASARWQTGGGGFFGGEKKEVVPPGGSLLTWAQVPLFTAKALLEAKGNLRHADVSTVYFVGPSSPRSRPTRVTILGDISRTADQRDVVGQLYVPLDLQPEMSEEWRERMRKTPQMRDLLGANSLSDVPWSLSEPVALSRFRASLAENCALYRIATITASLQDCVSATEEDKPRSVVRLSRELDRCGRAEREWFIRQIPYKLETLDSVSRRLFMAAFPSHGESYKLLSPEEGR